MENIKRVWPKWEVLEVLGQGGFGTVYKAKRENYGDTSYAAIKVVKIPSNISEVKEMTGSGLSQEHIKSYYKKSILSLVDEIKMMSKFKTASHIVSIEDFDVLENDNGLGGTIYIRMELLKNIADHFDISNINKDEVIKMAIDILTALEFCHKQNVIHRDIKPGNIFVSEFGEYKLGDFGISREVEKTNATMSQKGTKSYMAPEMIRMEKYGKNVDLYALGLTMYELLNHGRIPFLPDYPEPFFPQDREEAMIKRLMGEEFPPIKGLGKLNDIIKKACHPQSDERYQDATEMKTALLSLNNQTVEEKPLFNEEKTFNGEQDILFEDKSTIGMFSDLPFEKENKSKNTTITKQQVLDYVVNRFNKENHTDLRNDQLALQRLEYVVNEKLNDLNSTGKILLDIPYLTIGNEGALHLKMTVEKHNFNADNNHQSSKPLNDGWLFGNQEKVDVDDEPIYQRQTKVENLSMICPHCGKLALVQMTHVYACTGCGEWVNAGLDQKTFDKMINLFVEYNTAGDQKDYNKQIRILNQMLSHDPTCAQIYMRLGQAYGAVNQSNEQLRAYLKALEMDNRDALVHNGLCVCYNRAGNWPLAYEYGKKAYEKMKQGAVSRINNEGVICSNYSMTLEKTNRSMEAHKMLKEARKYNYANIKALIFDWGIGTKYYQRIINEIYSVDRLRYSKNVQFDPKKYGQCRNILSIDSHANVIFAVAGEKWFGPAYPLVVTDRAIYFMTGLGEQEKYYMPYYDLINYNVTYNNKNLTFTGKYNKNLVYTLQVGKDAQLMCKFLRELQNRL